MQAPADLPIQTVYLVRNGSPFTKIAIVDAPVKSTPRQAVALYGGKSYLIGATAFYNESAAFRRKEYALRKIIEGPRHGYGRNGGINFAVLWEKAATELQNYKLTHKFPVLDKRKKSDAPVS